MFAPVSVIQIGMFGDPTWFSAVMMLVGDWLMAWKVLLVAGSPSG